MNRFLIILAIATLLTGCSSDKTDKLDSLAQKLTIAELGSADGYEPLQTIVIDSAFAPFDDPSVVNDYCRIFETAEKEFPEGMEVYEKKVKESSAIIDSLTKKKVINNGELLAKAIATKLECAKQAKAFMEVVKKLSGDYELSHNIYSHSIKRKEWLGFTVKHKFNLNHNGETKTDSMVFLIDDKQQKMIDRYMTESKFFDIVCKHVDSLKAARLYIK